MNDQLIETARAFDSVAADYDGPLGNNALIQIMRARTMDVIEHSLPRGGDLLDLGCGTGIDAEYLARRGYGIVALDHAPAMVAHANERLTRAGLTHLASAECIGIHELTRLDAAGFEGAYSNFGAINCVPDLQRVSSALALKLKPRGLFIASVIGRYCPWELLFYAARGDFERAKIRFARGSVPVPLNGQTVWSRYYGTHEFYRAFASDFELTGLCALGLFLPPPYLIHLYETRPRAMKLLERMDRSFATMPFLRNLGDHFLITLRKRR
jgi:SAM-dependent methyltransferase